MYYIDSLTYRVALFDYEPGTGAIGNRRTFASVGAGDVMPDGLAVDSEGSVWVALWGGSEIRRYAPDGHLTLSVDIPAANVTSCAFGGPDLRTLFITTAAGPGRSGGALFTCQVEVAGLPANPYRG
jgi:sugar lactone lactonase YvrE